MPRKTKTYQELKQAGTYRADRHKSRNIELVGEKLSSLAPIDSWSDKTKELFKLIVQPQISLGVLYPQDIPTLFHMGEVLNELELLEQGRIVYEAKKVLTDQDTDLEYISTFLNTKLKLIKMYDQLVKPYLVSPYGRLKALAVYSLTENNEINKAIKAIDQGVL